MPHRSTTRKRPPVKEAVTIVLPLPPTSLNAHNKGHWKWKFGPTQKCRESAKHAASQWDGETMARCVLSVDFYWPTLARRDTFNAVQTIKPYIDGLVDAGVMSDDNWRAMNIGHVRSHLDRTNPRVELTVEELP